MKQFLSEITLGVANLADSVRFYRVALGFQVDEFSGNNVPHSQSATINALPGVSVILRPLKSLSYNIGSNLSSDGLVGVTLGYRVGSMEEVDALLERAFEAEVTVRFASENVWGGYSGYFQDPDRYLWEVGWKP